MSTTPYWITSGHLNRQSAVARGTITQAAALWLGGRAAAASAGLKCSCRQTRLRRPGSPRPRCVATAADAVTPPRPPSLPPGLPTIDPNPRPAC